MHGLFHTCLCVKYSMDPFLPTTPTGLRVETVIPFLVSLMDAFSTRGYTFPWKGALAMNTRFCKETSKYNVISQWEGYGNMIKPHNCWNYVGGILKGKLMSAENTKQESLQSYSHDFLNIGQNCKNCNYHNTKRILSSGLGRLWLHVCMNSQ